MLREGLVSAWYVCQLHRGSNYSQLERYTNYSYTTIYNKITRRPVSKAYPHASVVQQSHSVIIIKQVCAAEMAVRYAALSVSL